MYSVSTEKISDSLRGRSNHPQPQHTTPYALYGTPLPPLDSGMRDDGSYVPIWRQEVTNERGRKRLHGAFTGGFSAGYFNTVGSKEGWAPASFSSSRQNRAKDSKQADFVAFGSTQSDLARSGGLMDLFKITGPMMGTKLLQRMGWREGQGIGPKVHRTADLADSEHQTHDRDSETHLFAPKNPPTIAFVRKLDRKGLGFEGEARLGSSWEPEDGAHSMNPDYEESDPFLGSRPTGKVEAGQVHRGAFGVGVLNDTSSDDDESYSMGPQISYNRTIGGDKKKKKPKPAADENRSMMNSSNPLASAKPVFVSKKMVVARDDASGFRKCYDGRLPLDRYVLAQGLSGLSIGSYEKHFSPPEIPNGWKPSKHPSAEKVSSNYLKASTLDPSTRAELLGEAQLPGKSIFDWMAPEARERPERTESTEGLPDVRGREAEGPLGSGSRLDDVTELQEFTWAAEVFRPISGIMASRFTSASWISNFPEIPRQLAFYGSVTGGACRTAAINHDIRRSIVSGGHIAKSKRSLQTFSSGYGATSAARWLARKIEAAEDEEFMGLSSLNDNCLARNERGLIEERNS
ncbi:hypothetical protein Egran_05518 [Elaphomyces granulatus]|uniref:G-patch domain-containing protein n=1 Tax=Elaphomyces granulatus TaxID=519963 RepID=A0A232LRC7_9EURO|nr:hypothetical protein Egran_05518 [Elaphomyces granulatus]